MFTRTDLIALIDVIDTVTVSIFVPTVVSGDQTRQGRIHLKNAITRARPLLQECGLGGDAIDQLLAPAEALLGDNGFWQHQSEGLAVFLAPSLPSRHFSVPIPFAEDVVVADTFFIAPLLPLLSADGAFTVLAMTADRVRLFAASRFGLEEVHDSGLPESITASLNESDYENPLQASPVARPHTANINISNAQVYGDSPAEWRSARTTEFANRVSVALHEYSAAEPRPTVLVSNAEFIGLLGSTGAITLSVDINPESLDDRELHAAAYEKMRPLFDSTRVNALEELAMLHGRGDPRAIVEVAGVARASAEGRVKHLFYRPTVVEGPGEGNTTLRGMVNAAIIDTIRNGGTIYAVDDDDDVTDAPVSAVLRY